MSDITPVLPGTIWKYKDEVYFILTSQVNIDKTWEIDMVSRNKEIISMTVTCEEWLREAKYMGEIEEEDEWNSQTHSQD
jgi:hypothetical protein